MTKKLSNTKQISILKRLRRACPFAVFSGNYGYTCGGMVGGIRSSSGMAARSKEARHCMLSCSDLRCFHAGLQHHTSNSQDKRLWLRY